MSEKKLDLSKLSDFEVSLLVIERDVSQYRVERIDELLNQIGVSKGFEEASKKTEKAKIPEDSTFNTLNWSDEKGTRLADYQVSYKNHNASDSWQHAFNILKANNSLIASPFKEEGYVYWYWIFPPKYEDRIFRKKLSEAKP